MRYCALPLGALLSACSGAVQPAPASARPASPTSHTRPAFVDPAAGVEPIRFAEREPLDASGIDHIAEVGALCAPRYDEVEGELGCERCPTETDFHFPAPTLKPELTRGPGRWRVHDVFEGHFTATGERQALLATDGCEYRSNGLILVSLTEDGWIAGLYFEGVPFGRFSKCDVAQSPKWGDVLVCEGTLLTQMTGVRRTRGFAPFAWTLTIAGSVGKDVDSGDVALDELVVAEDPEPCASTGGRGKVVRTKFKDFSLADTNGDGQTDVTLDISYLIAAAAGPETCQGDAGLKPARLSFVRRKGGFTPDPRSSTLIRRLGLQ